MNILLISPGFPAEMPLFTGGLSGAGARVLGLGDQPEEGLPAPVRRHLSGYLRVDSLWNEAAAVALVLEWSRTLPAPIERVECLWEPGVLLAAKLREALGLPGMTVEETVPFRDKEKMKQVLDRAGIRTPRHEGCRTERECRIAAERIGYPLIVKPIAGAGSMDTHRVDDRRGLEAILPQLRHVEEVSVEECIEGEEYTFDTICADGELLFSNISWYRPRPLIARTVQWISPQTVALRDNEGAELASGREMGRAVLQAFGFRTGFTHMEWFRQSDGTAVFGEIACRPPGARSVDIMNEACDADLFRAWAEAVCRGRLPEPIERRYNAVVIFKRAEGEGRIREIEGLARLQAAHGEHIVGIDLLPVGAPRRNWRHTLLSDGFVTIRHPDLSKALEIADRIGTDLRLYAG
jgi:hypothetical protein